MLSEKYGRTYHYPFSPGTTSDDRINHTYWEDIQQIETLIHTEKLDGENNCLSRHGVFARSHAAPTTSPWTRELRERWSEATTLIPVGIWTARTADSVLFTC